MQHTRSEDAMKNIEKGKTFCFNSAFYGWKVVFGSDFTFQHLEEEWGTGKVEEEYEYFKQSCVVASRCRFTRNGIAINQSVDGRLVDCSFNKNDYAIVLRENSGFTTISNCRIEWNNYNGIYSEKAHEVTVSNCEFDRNGYAGLYAVENTNSNFNGIFRRNGAKVISDTEDTRDDFVNNVHIYAHRNVNCNFIGSNTTVKATSDVGSAPERPTNCSNFSENVNCVITSNNLYGCTKKDKEDANRFKNNVDCFFENNMSDNEVFDAKSAIAKTNTQLSDIIANNLTVSVKHYGALGDGVTDDTQAFINALNALKPNGGYLFIPKTPNFYRITNQIEITNEHGYVVVYGEGKSSHIKLTQKSSNGHLIGFIGTPENKLKGGCAKDLQLSTYLSETNQDDNCIGTMYSENIVFDNIYVSTCTWKGITAQRGVTNFKIKNCYVENCKEAGITVEFSDCENIYIENSTVKNIDKIGVHITNAGDVNKMNNVYITNVTVDGCSEHNVACSGIDNGHIDKLSSLSSQNGHGIQIYNSLNISIDKCDVRNNGYAGINVQNSNNVTIYKTVSKFNSISDLEKRGNVFVRQDSSNVKIIDSDISEGVRAFSSQNDELTLFNTLYKGATNNPVIPVIRELDNTNSIALIKSGDWTDIDTSLYAPMQVRHRNGFIHIIGALQGGNISPGQSLAIIPEGFRPLFNHQYSVKCIANGVADFALIRCDKDGRIVIEKTPVGTTEIYLGVSYLL